MPLSAFAAETITSMGMLLAFFIAVLYFLGYPVKALYRIVRNLFLSILFLSLYNMIFANYGLHIGLNPLTVSVLTVFGVDGFAALNMIMLFL